MTVRADLPRETDTPVKARRQNLPFSTRRTHTVSRCYGRFDGIMRILLPTIATALLILVALWPQLTDQQRRYAITPARIASVAENNLTRATGVQPCTQRNTPHSQIPEETVHLANGGHSSVGPGAP